MPETLEASRNEHLKAERDKTRFMASELIDALRGRHPNASWVPVNFEDEDRLEPELNNSQLLEKPNNKSFGPGRETVWSRCDYRALEVYPQWWDADGMGYRIVLGEPTLDALKVRWHQRGAACRHCAYPLRFDEPVNHFTSCEWQDLMVGRDQVFIGNGEKGIQRNKRVTPLQAEMALELFAGCAVINHGRALET